MNLITAQKITQTFNGRIELGVAGEYFKILAAPAALDVELWSGGRKVLDAPASDAGFYQRTAFDKIVLTNGSSQAVSVLVAGDQGGSDRFTGSFTAQGTLGTLAQVAIGGVNALQVTERGYSYGATFSSSANLAALTSQQVFAPGANVNGAIVWGAYMMSKDGGASTGDVAITAHTAAPNSLTVGDVLATSDGFHTVTGAIIACWTRLYRPVFVAAGKGLYFTASRAETSAIRSAAYTLL